MARPVVHRPYRHFEPQPDPVRHAELFVKSPREMAAEIREAVEDMRQLREEHGPTCHGHPYHCGHIYALRTAQFLEAIPEDDGLFLGYGEIVDALNKCPVTYLPALLMTVVERCEVEGVYVSGGIVGVVRAVVEKVEAQSKVRP